MIAFAITLWTGSIFSPRFPTLDSWTEQQKPDKWAKAGLRLVCRLLRSGRAPPGISPSVSPVRIGRFVSIVTVFAVTIVGDVEAPGVRLLNNRHGLAEINGV